MKDKFIRHLKFLKKFIVTHQVAIILLTIILFGAFLRLDDFSNLARFNQDQVRDAQIIDAMAKGESLPLLGPKAGGTTFKLGPAFYYLQYLSGIIFGFTPSGIAFFVPILAIFSIGLFYLLLRNIFSAKISLTLTFLYAISFYAIKYSRFAWNPNSIPFFLFAFILLLLPIISRKAKTYHHLLLGLVIGIGMQLHTTMLILMPLFLFLVYFYAFCKDSELKINFSIKKLAKSDIKFKKINPVKILKGLLVSLLIIIVLNLPFFVYDFQYEGRNIKAFFAGAGTKTEKTVSFPKKILLDTQLFAQGSTYVLTGYEPQKNWLNPIKLLRSKSLSEISLAVFSSSLLLVGAYLLYRRIRKEKDGTAKNTLLIVASFSILSFLLFLPLGNELNIRFFITLIFLPFILLGLILEKISQKYNKILLLALLAFILSFFFLNINTYSKTYDLENYRAPESAYGGISVGEAEKIAKFILDKSNQAQKNPYYEKFEFSRSVVYFAQKDGVKVSAYSEKNGLPENGMLFVIAKKESLDKLLKEKNRNYEIIDSFSIGRFFVIALLPKEFAECKLGFITDLHTKRPKSTPKKLDITETRTLQNFLTKMNDDFKPDLVFDGGDTIEGTNRKGQKSIDDYLTTLSHFEKLSVPSYHVIGNHDLRGLSRIEWARLNKKTDTYYYIDHKGFRFFVLDGSDRSDGDKNRYAMSDMQINWLEKSLSETEKPKIVFIHYPLFQQRLLGGDKILSDSQALQLHELFSKNNVLAVFSGHTETLSYEERDSVRYFVLPGTDRSQKKPVHWYECFSEITSRENKVNVDLYYKKSIGKGSYEKLPIPSEKYDGIEK